MDKFYGVVLGGGEGSSVVEIFTSQGMRYTCFVKKTFHRVLSKGLSADFVIISGRTLPLVCEVIYKAYPKVSCVLDLELIHGLLNNCLKLVQPGACEPEIYKIVESFLQNYNKLDGLEGKKLFFRASVASILLQLGFLGQELSGNMDDWMMASHDNPGGQENNFQRGFTIEKIDAKITLFELLSCASKEFNLNLFLV